MKKTEKINNECLVDKGKMLDHFADVGNMVKRTGGSMKKTQFKCRHCGKNTNFIIELINGRFNYNFYCRHCKQKNTGTIVEKTEKKDCNNYKSGV